MKTKHDLKRVETWNPRGGPRINVSLTPAAYRMAMEAPWPARPETLTLWWADVIREEAKREAKKRRRALPRGEGFEANLARRAEDLARACLAELELAHLVFQDAAAMFRQWPESRHGQNDLPGDPEALWYGLGAVLGELRRK